MYDYMKALQKRFDCQEHSKLDAQIKSAHEELRWDMDAAGRVVVCVVVAKKEVPQCTTT